MVKNGSLALISNAHRDLQLASSLDDILKIRDTALALESYVKATRESLLVQNQAAEIKVRAERKAGELIAKMEKGKPGPKDNSQPAKQFKSEQLEEFGVSKDQAYRFEAIASVPDDDFEVLVDPDIATIEDREITSASVQRAAKPHVANNSGENEWYTPPEIIEAARASMNGIDLDPASSTVAQELVNAKAFYTIQDNGLSKPWRGRVWLNPPYSKDLISRFTEKLLEHYRAGDIAQACVLVNNATDTGWFQDLASAATAICFFRGRIKFIDKTSTVRSAPLQGQALLYLGTRKKTFCNCLASFGFVVEAVK